MDLNKQIYITIDHLDDFESLLYLKTGDRLKLKKDRNNIYDDEAIAVYNGNDHKCGYVANSVRSVARGTYSAGRLYDLMKEEDECIVKFIFTEEGVAIGEL